MQFPNISLNFAAKNSTNEIFVLSFDKIGCTSEEKQTSLFCFSLGLHYLCSSYNKSEIQQKLFPMSYLFAIIVLAALFKAFNS